MTDAFYNRLINDFCLSLSEVAEHIPFSGDYWVEQVNLGTAQKTLEANKDKIQFNSNRPIDICQTYINFLASERVLDIADYTLSDDGGTLNINLKREKCIYKRYCDAATAKGSYFNCTRMAAFQAILKNQLGADFGMKVTIVGEECQGMIYPKKRVSQIVSKEGDLLKIAGERAIVLPLQTYISLITAIKEHAPFILRQVLYEAGYSSGLIIAQKSKTLYNSSRECLEGLCDELTRSGLGKIELVSFNKTEGRVIFRCHDSFQVAASEDHVEIYRSPRVVCDLLRGTFAAYVTVLLGRKMICEEMQCQSMKNNYCEFLALPM